MRLQEGFVVAYDFKGRRLWDYSIPMNDFKANIREQVSDFAIVNNVPHFLFKDEEGLRFSNHATDTAIVAESSVIHIQLKNEYEQARDGLNVEGNVRHWYGSYFYVWGIQTVKDARRKDSDSNRRVFFINKIQVE